MSKKNLKKNNVNTAANELSEDALGAVAGGLEVSSMQFFEGPQVMSLVTVKGINPETGEEDTKIHKIRGTSTKGLEAKLKSEGWK